MYFRVSSLSLLLTFSGCSSKNVGERIETTADESNISTKAEQIIAGAAHVCALLDDQRVKCWGDNEYGQCDLTAARNATGKLYDVSRARFSKLTAGSLFTCGILAEPGFDGIPVCFGEEDKWLNVPHEKVIDIAAWGNFTCFIKADGKLGCVGQELKGVIKSNGTLKVKAEDLPKHGISGEDENSDFSHMMFKSIKAGHFRVCAQDLNGYVHCMGDNFNKTGDSISEIVSDFSVGSVIHFITTNGKLGYSRIKKQFEPLAKISKPRKLKYKKIVASDEGLLTAPGNYYDDGTPMPENTFIPYIGEVEEGVLDVAVAESSSSKDKIRIRCVIKENHKVVCRPHINSQSQSPEASTTLLIKDLPQELAYH